MLTLHLNIWRQAAPEAAGGLRCYTLEEVSPEASFLEMLDQLNEQLLHEGQEPVAFDHDCREGICGACSLVIDGIPHGPQRGGTACQLHMRHFHSGQTITIEPFHARAFPILKDLVVDRRAFDRILAAGGYISTHTGAAPEANTVPISKKNAEAAMDAAACIGCGACVAACKNASAMLFVGAKLAHLHALPQGQPERPERTRALVAAMDAEGFGSCSNYGECSAVCPKGISLDVICMLNKEYWASGGKGPVP